MNVQATLPCHSAGSQSRRQQPLLEHSPVKVFLSPSQSLQHLLASKRGDTSLGSTFRAHKADLSSTSEDLDTLSWDAGLHIDGIRFSVLMW